MWSVTNKHHHATVTNAGAHTGCSDVPIALTDLDTPGSYQEAVASSNAGAWRIAMHKEHMSILCNQTYHLEPLPAGHKAIHTQWLFKVKLHTDGTVKCHKAHWVAKGYSQQYRINYNITYAPVVQLENLHLLLVLAAALDLEVHQMDINLAFLHAQLTEEIYVTQPEGFESSKYPGHVCCLLKSLYGLKQAPYVWNQAINNHLQQHGFRAM
jgi:hypothetical protein